MRFLLLPFLFLATNWALAQSFDIDGSTTRAVVVGISDYSDDRISDLRFAHADAQAFAAYLQSTAGGSMTNDQITLLTNAQATAGKIIAAFDWLIAESKPGDRALIYFSGHGDVERLTKFQRGYLLCHDAPGTTYMAGGSLSVGSLEDIITTLSEAGVKVLMISDACHAGKLAGSVNGGTQATTASLAQQFSSEIKILSCQPEEFSLEGEQWGGGRGCFSFHLVDALTGMADANADGSVNLLETGRYLEEKVPAETAPHNQIPMTVGNKSAVLSAVQPEALVALQQRKAGHVSTLSPIDAKGFEDMILAKTDTSVQQLYAAFTAALERGDLMSPAGTSANDYYLRLLPEPGIEKLKGLMTRNLAAALQDEAQVVINQLLRTDPQIVDDAFSPVSRYDHLPAYLARAAELLGEKHYMYRFLKAREYFFRSKTLRVENHPGIPADSLLHRQLACLDTALTFDVEAAYLYFEKGYLQFWGMRKWPELYCRNFEKAVALSPEWVLPIYFLGRTTASTLGDKVNGIPMLKKAIELDSTFLPVYRELGWAASGNEKKFWFEEYVSRMRSYERLNPGRVPVTYLNYLGNSLWRLGRNEEAKAALLKGVEISKGKFPLLFANLGVVYCDLGQYEEAERAALKLIELNPLSYEGYSQLVEYRLYFLKKNRATVPGLCWRAIELGATRSYDDLTFYFQQKGQPDSAALVVREWLQRDSANPQAILRLGQTHLMHGNNDAARIQFERLASDTTGLENVELPPFYYRLVALLQLGRDDELPTFLESERLIFKSNDRYRFRFDNDQADFCFRAACAFASCGRSTPALGWLEKALQAGWKTGPAGWVVPTLFNPDLDPIRHTRRFKKMVKKYFPEQARIMKIK